MIGELQMKDETEAGKSERKALQVFGEREPNGIVRQVFGVRNQGFVLACCQLLSVSSYMPAEGLSALILVLMRELAPVSSVL